MTISIVALFTEGVDWNGSVKLIIFCSKVALFTEGVDWNIFGVDIVWNKPDVALFTEGVDWNLIYILNLTLRNSRPLHRGCGLKYCKGISEAFSMLVALFTEGVDWNLSSLLIMTSIVVALFTEGVDWNLFLHFHNLGHFPRRPLHRGCGLKSNIKGINMWSLPVALFTEGVDWNKQSMIL